MFSSLHVALHGKDGTYKRIFLPLIWQSLNKQDRGKEDDEGGKCCNVALSINGHLKLMGL